MDERGIQLTLLQGALCPQGPRTSCPFLPPNCGLTVSSEWGPGCRLHQALSLGSSGLQRPTSFGSMGANSLLPQCGSVSSAARVCQPGQTPCFSLSKKNPELIRLPTTALLGASRRHSHRLTHYKLAHRLPWWLRGIESTCECRRHGFDPWSRRIPHALEQLSLCAPVIEAVLWSPGATTTEPVCPRACALQREKSPP